MRKEKTASTSEIIEYLQSYEKKYGVGAVESIGTVSAGNRETKYIFHIEDKRGEDISVSIPTIDKNTLWN